MKALIAITFLVFILRAFEFIHARKFVKKTGRVLPLNILKFEKQNRLLFDTEEKKIIRNMKTILLFKWIAIFVFIFLFVWIIFIA